MIPAPFDYERPSTVDEAIALLSERGDEAKLLAGGHSLLPLMKLRLATPAVLVDVGRFDELRYVRDAGDHVSIGALSRHRDLEVDPLLEEHVPLLAHCAGQVGDPQVRHRGTVGGSVAHGDPASDLPAVLLALDATYVARGPGGEHSIAAADFSRGFLETALGPDEVLVEIQVPKRTGVRWSFQKFSRRSQDWAIVGVAAVRDGTTAVALVNMGTVPLRATRTEEALSAGASVAEAAERADDGTEPTSDLSASSDFRRHLSRVLVRRALEEVGA